MLQKISTYVFLFFSFKKGHFLNTLFVVARVIMASSEVPVPPPAQVENPPLKSMYYYYYCIWFAGHI